MTRTDLVRIDECQWELPASFRDGMRVPIHLFAPEAMLDPILASDTLEQTIQTAMLPGLIGTLVVMPDVQAGEVVPAGSVVATKYPVGVVAPMAIGREINSGVRVLGSDIDADTMTGRLDELIDALDEYIPQEAGGVQLRPSQVDRVAQAGAQWAYRNGFAEQDDLVHIEEGGRLGEADPSTVSDEARKRAEQQLGTLGGSGHFVEVAVVDGVFDPAAAQTLRLQEGRVVVHIHAGSGAYGRQITEDYVTFFQEAASQNGRDLGEDGPAYAPLDAPEAADFAGALQAAANVAYANRQVLAHRVRQAFEAVGHDPSEALHTVYDMAYNMGRLEMHRIDGRLMRCYVHRKGAARALGPGTPGIAAPYRALGQPILVSGGLGDNAWMMVGTTRGMAKSFASVGHGPRPFRAEHAADVLTDRLEPHGRTLGSPRSTDTTETSTLELSSAVDTVVEAQLAKKVARLHPLAIMRA